MDTVHPDWGRLSPPVRSPHGADSAGQSAIVAQMTQDRFLGVVGEPRVNVLKLNLGLDALK